MNKDDAITVEFDKLVKELRLLISDPRDLSKIAISLELSHIQCLILDSAFKGLPTISLGKILLIIPDDFYVALEDITLKLSRSLQNRTFLNLFKA
jgi:hypothetical protein